MFSFYSKKIFCSLLSYEVDETHYSTWFFIDLKCHLIVPEIYI